MTEISYATLFSNAHSQTFDSSGGYLLATWYNFVTNDTDTFGTNVGTGSWPYAGDTNTAGDRLLKIKTPGIYLFDFYARWTNGTYDRHIEITPGSGVSLPINVGTVESDWRTSDFDYETSYTSWVFYDNDLPAYVQFYLGNNSGVSKTVSDRGVSIIKLPVDPEAGYYQVYL